MGYTEAKYGIKRREWLVRPESSMTEASLVQKPMCRTFPGAINITKLGFLSIADNATSSSRCEIQLYRDKHTTAMATMGVSGYQNAVMVTGQIASVAITTGTIVSGSTVTVKLLGTCATPMKGIIFFDYVVPFVLEDAEDKWDGSS
jgi:hypothetical protein